MAVTPNLDRPAAAAQGLMHRELAGETDFQLRTLQSSGGLRVRALRGSLFEPVAGETFDLIATNPPYVPAPTDELPGRGTRRAWDAGRDGRALIDPICDAAAAHLNPGGVILIVHSSLCGTDLTLSRLTAAGLDAEVVGRERGPLGPLMLARVEQLEASGALAPGEREEEMVVIRGRKPPG